jgi:hypothetical protein
MSGQRHNREPNTPLLSWIRSVKIPAIDSILAPRFGIVTMAAHPTLTANHALLLAGVVDAVRLVASAPGVPIETRRGKPRSSWN